MCKKLFIEKDCCRDCLMKYTPFGQSRKIFTTQEAEIIHKEIDELYSSMVDKKKSVLEMHYFKFLKDQQSMNYKELKEYIGSLDRIPASEERKNNSIQTLNAVIDICGDEMIAHANRPTSSSHFRQDVMLK